MTKMSQDTAEPADLSDQSSSLAEKPTHDKARKSRTSAKKVPPSRKGEVVADSPLYYVGIGASAGGLEALRPFVLGLPAHANMTYIVAQHMSPDHRSLMVELLARETSLKVEEASNNMPPKADTIYVAPPNSDVTVINGKLHISKPTNTIGPKPSVDRFFISLADDQEDHAIGIILSGTGSDGARGIKAIKAAGGISIAQEPKSAKYDSMPNAAIRAGGADLVLPPHEIATQLGAIVRRPRPPIVDEADEAPPSTIRGIIRQIATYTGMDFSNYKDATISRQILRRMAAIQIPSLDAYGEYIAAHRRELTELASNFLICVTSFFRDPESFDAVRRSLREMLKSKRPGDDIRIWIPGCATGEEVYTVAILLAEELGQQRDKFKIQLFATDINSEAIAVARAGIYPEAALSGIDSALIARYFATQNGMYQIDKSLRDMTLFARQDLVQDPPFVRLDMVSCRNLLIYFKTDLQERVMKVFHYSLRANGVLFLGKSETVGRLGNLFVERDRKNKIFLKRQVASPIPSGFARARGLPGGEVGEGEAEKAVSTPTSSLGHERLFELYTPASLLMTSAGEIQEVFGDCGSFLSISKGKANFNAFAMIRPAFRAELRAFAHRVSRTKLSAVCNPVEVLENGKNNLYRMAVHYAGQSGTDDPTLLLVCFEAVIDTGNQAAQIDESELGQNQRIAELEREIVLSRENLQTVIEELETANEELQSLNEEAQAGNEELQASNEELETANEELQASNEELVTVNDELSARSLELNDTNNDLNNILNSLCKAVIVVDSNLSITRYNNVAREFFDIPSDKMPNLASVVTHFHAPNMLGNISKVLIGGALEELEFKRDDGRAFLMRLTPYVDSSQQDIRGVVMTIQDVTEQKVSEEKLRLSATVFEHASEATLITDANNRIISVNPAFSTITGYSAEDVIGRTPSILNSGKHPKEFFESMWKMLLSKGMWEGEIQNRRKNGEIYAEWLSINILRNEKGEIIHHIAVFSDVSGRKKTEMTLRKANADLERFAYVASHDLKTPLRNVTSYAQLIERRYKGKLDKDADDYIKFIVDGSKHMTRLIDDLLRYSKVGRGAEPLCPVQSGDAVATVMGFLKADIESAGAEVAVGDLPLVMGEASLLTSLFQNLLVNSVKYRAQDRPLRVSITAERVDRDWWRFAISDNGIGIDAKYFDKIFEIFQRLNPASEAEGTGIGLTLCRRIVEHFGGTIRVESKLGEGSTFFLTLLDAKAD